jgi:hypothetical protein
MDDHDDLSAPLADDDLLAIGALTVADVAAIDHAVLSVPGEHWQKTALVVSRAMYAYRDRYDDIPHVYYGQRVVELAPKGMLAANGNSRQLHFSEVRCPTAGTDVGSLGCGGCAR